MGEEFDKVDKRKAVEIDERNGWDEKSLGEYLKQREAQRQASLDPLRRSAPKQPFANSRYNPRKWR